MKVWVCVFISLIVLIFSCEQKHKRLTIGIQPLGTTDTAELTQVTTSIQAIFDAEVYILETVELPQSAFVNIKSHRYRGDSLLLFVMRNKPDSIDFIIGYTSQDISVTKRNIDGSIKVPESKYSDWGVFGLANLSGTTSIVSSFRLKGNKALFLERLSKISIHELGHSFGLPHCINDSCIMQDAAESIHTIDRVELYFCSKCHQRIFGKIGSDFSSNK